MEAKTLNFSAIARPSSLVGAMSDALAASPVEPATMPEDYQSEPDEIDGEGDAFLLRAAHAFGVTPIELLRIIHNGRATVAALEGFNEQPTSFALTGALGIPVSAVELSAANTFVDVTVANGFGSSCFVVGYFEVTVFKGGNTESGEQVVMEIVGRRAYPEQRQLVAGKVYRIPWGGMITQSHLLRFKSPQADNTNKVQIVITGRSRAMTIREIRHSRRFLGGLRSVAEGLARHAIESGAKMALDVSSINLSNKLAPILQQIGDGSLLARAKSAPGARAPVAAGAAAVGAAVPGMTVRRV